MKNLLFQRMLEDPDFRNHDLNFLSKKKRKIKQIIQK